jgi:CDP-diacylglycerol--glycerol-3-phosphate 3-phosphatidyltransferase
VLLKELGNFPNMLTLARIAVIPLFVWFTYDADPWYSMWAAVIFAAAALTDVVDGYLARRWNLVTVVGKFLDPLADKLIVTAALVMMVRLGRVAAWVVIVLIAREFIVTGLRAVAANEGIVIAAGQEGKWKTSTQLVAIICLCVHYVHPVWLVFSTYNVDFNVVGKWLLYISTVLSVWSAGVYFKGFLDTLARRGSAEAS